MIWSNQWFASASVNTPRMKPHDGRGVPFGEPRQPLLLCGFLLGHHMTKERVRDGMGTLYEPEPNSGCWLWLLGCSNDGYGKLWLNSHNKRAHRVMYELFIGPIPDELYVCHTCDNPLCVNPAHLWLGTNADNQRDSVKKGRANSMMGERHGRAKLTTKNIIRIRQQLACGITSIAVAQEHGVCVQHVNRIKRRDSWRHFECIAPDGERLNPLLYLEDPT